MHGIIYNKLYFLCCGVYLNKKCLRNINAPHGAKFKMAIPVKGIMKLVLYTRQN